MRERERDGGERERESKRERAAGTALRKQEFRALLRQVCVCVCVCVCACVCVCVRGGLLQPAPRQPTRGVGSHQQAPRLHQQVPRFRGGATRLLRRAALIAARCVVIAAHAHGSALRVMSESYPGHVLITDISESCTRQRTAQRAPWPGRAHRIWSRGYCGLLRLLRMIVALRCARCTLVRR